MKKYEKPQITISEFQTENIITASSTGGKTALEVAMQDLQTTKNVGAALTSSNYWDQMSVLW